MCNVSPIKNEKDVVILFIITFRDISILKQPFEDDNGKGKSETLDSYTQSYTSSIKSSDTEQPWLCCVLD